MPKFGQSFFTPKGFSDEKVTIYSSIGATHKITPPSIAQILEQPIYPRFVAVKTTPWPKRKTKLTKNLAHID